MKKIGGIKMNSTMHLVNKKTLLKERKYNLFEALEQSLKEVKMHREGKIKLDTWEEYIEKKRKKEQ